MVHIKDIIGTPFKTSDKFVARNTNKRIRDLSADIDFTKEQMRLRELQESLTIKGLPRPRRRGAIE